MNIDFAVFPLVDKPSVDYRDSLVAWGLMVLAKEGYTVDEIERAAKRRLTPRERRLADASCAMNEQAQAERRARLRAERLHSGGIKPLPAEA